LEHIVFTFFENERRILVGRSIEKVRDTGDVEEKVPVIFGIRGKCNASKPIRMELDSVALG
jgi:hypothetical protein